MFKMIVYICYTLFVLFTTIEARALTMEERNEIALRCLNETGTPRELVEAAIKSQKIMNDENYKEFLACSYKLQGFMDAETGQPLLKNISTFLSDYYTNDEVKFIYKNCKHVKVANTQKETAHSLLKCLMQQLHEIDDIRSREKELSENDITG